jgi:hypothetical protein
MIRNQGSLDLTGPSRIPKFSAAVKGEGLFHQRKAMNQRTVVHLPWNSNLSLFIGKETDVVRGVTTSAGSNIFWVKLTF